MGRRAPAYRPNGPRYPRAGRTLTGRGGGPSQIKMTKVARAAPAAGGVAAPRQASGTLPLVL